jgi:hypothetical protein
MKRLVAAAVLLSAGALAAGNLAPPPAQAGSGDRIVWLSITAYAGVQIATSYPTAEDPYLHARFKRLGGEGQRQVRMGERHKKPGTHQWGHYSYTDPVALQVGERVVFTSERSVPCEPAVEPVGIVAQMRVRTPGHAWSRWETWIADDQRLLDCAEVLPG